MRRILIYLIGGGLILLLLYSYWHYRTEAQSPVYQAALQFVEKNDALTTQCGEGYKIGPGFREKKSPQTATYIFPIQGRLGNCKAKVVVILKQNQTWKGKTLEIINFYGAGS